MTASPCPYARHRDHDWAFRDRPGIIVCGICHPPVAHDPAGIVRRTDPDFDRIVAKHRRAAKKTTSSPARAKKRPTPSVQTGPTGQDALDL